MPILGMNTVLCIYISKVTGSSEVCRQIYRQTDIEHHVPRMSWGERVIKIKLVKMSMWEILETLFS